MPGGAIRLPGWSSTFSKPSKELPRTFPGLRTSQGAGSSWQSSIAGCCFPTRKMPRGRMKAKSESSDLPTCCSLAGLVMRTWPGEAAAASLAARCRAGPKNWVMPAALSVQALSPAPAQWIAALSLGPRSCRKPWAVRASAKHGSCSSSRGQSASVSCANSSRTRPHASMVVSVTAMTVEPPCRSGSETSMPLALLTSCWNASRSTCCTSSWTAAPILPISSASATVTQTTATPGALLSACCSLCPCRLAAFFALPSGYLEEFAMPSSSSCTSAAALMARSLHCCQVMTLSRAIASSCSAELTAFCRAALSMSSATRIAATITTTPRSHGVVVSFQAYRSPTTERPQSLPYTSTVPK
mmetsp:Transcript_35671/g.84533  ORF Transcript_35671/g.84533 Transcript_35671/m.84533 type:complete len:357 (-) Transcript_35671:99-1169(-)